MMPPPSELPAESGTRPTQSARPAQSAADVAAAIETFLAEHSGASVTEDGRLVFDLSAAKYAVKAEGDHCHLQFWDDSRHLARAVVSAELRAGTLRLATARPGQRQTKLLQLVPQRQKVVRGKGDPVRAKARSSYVKLLERVLARQFPDATPDGFRTSMDLEKSFGPAYARGWLLQGNRAMAVIGVNAEETATTMDGILTAGILWLHHCREQSPGRKQFVGLRVVLPRGSATLTAARIGWLNADAAAWELWELDAGNEELTERDPDDQGNLRTRLIHRPDEAAASERFAEAVMQVMSVVPEDERERVETRLRSSTEMAFLLHGLEFARARFTMQANSFAPRLQISVGEAGQAVPLEASRHEGIAATVAELFARRRAVDSSLFVRKSRSPVSSRGIGPLSTQPAHRKVQGRVRPVAGQRSPQQDPLYRAAPERWLESVLRKDLATLTRGLAPATAARRDADDAGNRAESMGEASRVIPRLDARHVYTQVPAIAGASDRGMLDLLGVTADGRLAVIELKADEDMHFALQGLDYWVRVRHHHLQRSESAQGGGVFQQHGYFRGVELAEQAPRLYLVAPALRIHPATEVVLGYFSRRVEWNLLALDERWRSQIRVVWRRQGGRG